MHKNVTEKFSRFRFEFSNSTDVYHLQPSLYPSLADIKDYKITFIEKRSFTVKLFKRTQKSEIYRAIVGFHYNLFDANVGIFPIFWSFVGNQLEVLLEGRNHRKQETACNILRTHCHDVQKPDWVKKSVGDTKCH